MSESSTEISVAGLPIAQLQDVLAESGPGPAGGSAAALAATMAAGLVRLVARVSEDWPEAPGVAAQASALGDRSLALADEDHRVYARAMAELAAPDRDATLGAALRHAAEVPLHIAETAADVTMLAALAAREGSETVRADAWAAAASGRGGDRGRGAPRPREPGDASRGRALRTRRRGGTHRRERAGGRALRIVSARPIPSWSLPPGDAPAVAAPGPWREALTREWAIGGSRGAVDVCIVDSGVEAGHPLVGPLASARAVARAEDGSVQIVEDDVGDVVGHGTACAGIVRSLAPDCRLHSVRVLGAGNTGAGELILAGLRHAIDAGHRVINLSLSTTKRRFAEELHELADDAYFKRTLIVASAHNLPVDSYPWRFSSVISVGSHERPDPLAWFANPDPPVELFARGVDVDVAWLGGGRLRCTGNSFAAPHVAGISALVLAKHPELTPYQVKTVLRLTATNTEGTS